MSVPLRLLIIEDSSEDALLLIHELKRGDFELTYHRVDTPSDLIAALDSRPWDLIISDYVMPHFSGLKALRIVRERGSDIPFIIITDKISDDLAVEVMKAGAQDYLRKGNLTRLIPAINRELVDASVRRKNKAGEDSLRKLSYAVEQSSTIIVITDIHHMIEYVNPRFTQVTGYTKEEIIGKSPKIVASGRTPPEIYKELKSAIAAGHEWRGEFANRRRDGEIYWESAVISPIRDEQGCTTSIIKIADDISDRKRMEEELRQAKNAAESANRAKTQFLANMSHELRTPLNGILGMVELLMDRPLGDKERDFTEIIHHSASSLLGIVSDVLDLAKAESDQLLIEALPFNLKNVISETTRLVEGLAFRKNLTIKTEYDSSIPASLCGDPRRIRQLLMNLTSNALKFTDKGGVTISISLKSFDGQNAEVMFSVADTGIGIDPDNCRRLFQPFEQIDGTSTRKYGGMGVGLALTQRLVTIMNGSIGVNSRPGAGSVFHFTLPIRVNNAGQAVAKTIPVLSKSATHRSLETVPAFAAAIPEVADQLPDGNMSKVMNSSATVRKVSILIAEDDPVNRYLILSQLQTLGHQGQAVANGQAALNAVATTNFDLILMDCQMPVMDGFAATRAIRSFSTSHKPVVVALTAHVNADDREMCLAAGMDDFLSKPFKLEQLKELLQKWLSPEQYSAGKSLEKS
ncbi:MAG: response regulator [Candidatus Riflebacteria bacterium]|nr:response regulator [Candidatus Riflebacteria bacterium]